MFPHSGEGPSPDWKSKYRRPEGVTDAFMGRFSVAEGFVSSWAAFVGRTRRKGAVNDRRRVVSRRRRLSRGDGGSGTGKWDAQAHLVGVLEGFVVASLRKVAIKWFFEMIGEVIKE